MPNIIKSVRSAFSFIVSEAGGYRSRDQLDVEAPAADDLLVGSLVTGRAPATLWDGATGTPSGILCQTVEAGTTERRTVLCRASEVVADDLALPDGMTQDQAADALRPLGIIVRINRGQKIQVATPAPAE